MGSSKKRLDLQVYLEPRKALSEKSPLKQLALRLGSPCSVFFASQVFYFASLSQRAESLLPPVVHGNFCGSKRRDEDAASRVMPILCWGGWPIGILEGKRTTRQDRGVLSKLGATPFLAPRQRSRIGEAVWAMSWLLACPGCARGDEGSLFIRGGAKAQPVVAKAGQGPLKYGVHDAS